MSQEQVRPNDKARYAHARDPDIISVTTGLFRFENKEQALEKLEAIRSTYITSKQQAASDASHSLTLWIRGYGLTDAEKEQGLMGNYAVFSRAMTPDGAHTLKAVKVEAPRKQHPVKKPLPSRHPNWGHPVLQAVRDRRNYATVEEAQAQLDQLHRDHPDVTVPNPGKLYAMIYQRRRNAGNIRRMVLEIKTKKDGSVYIDCYRNVLLRQDEAKPERTKPRPRPKGAIAAATHEAHEAVSAPRVAKEKKQPETKKPARQKPGSPPAPEEGATPEGKYTAEVLLKRKKRRKKKPAGKPPTGDGIKAASSTAQPSQEGQSHAERLLQRRKKKRR